MVSPRFFLAIREPMQPHPYLSLVKGAVDGIRAGHQVHFPIGIIIGATTPDIKARKSLQTLGLQAFMGRG